MPGNYLLHPPAIDGVRQQFEVWHLWPLSAAKG